MKNHRFSFIRHGIVNGPAALYGKTDVAMEAHAQQAFLTRLEYLHQQNPIDYIISSPLKRCLSVAENLSKHHSIPVEINAGLQECNFGDWDGVDFNLLKSEWPLLEKFWGSPLNVCPPNGENLNDFCNRVSNAWSILKSQPVCDHTLVLCHGGTIRVIIAETLNIPLTGILFKQLHIDYCSHTCIEINSHVDAKPVIRWIGASL